VSGEIRVEELKSQISQKCLSSLLSFQKLPFTPNTLCQAGENKGNDEGFPRLLWRDRKILCYMEFERMINLSVFAFYRFYNKTINISTNTLYFIYSLDIRMACWKGTGSNSWRGAKIQIWRTPPWTCILGTLPAYQKQGFGRRMLHFLHDKAKKEGYKGIYSLPIVTRQLFIYIWKGGDSSWKKNFQLEM
jgi:GNAT superfamily N-acetyltransferase